MRSHDHGCVCVGFRNLDMQLAPIERRSSTSYMAIAIMVSQCTNKGFNQDVVQNDKKTWNLR
jgi:hypothetical protein